MTTVAVLQTDMLLNSAAFRTGMAQAAATANTALGQIQAESKKTAASIDLMSKAAGAFVGFEAVKEGVGALIEAQVQLQQIHFTLISATGSAQQAGDAFAYLQHQAQVLGLNLQPASQAFGQLAASAQASGVPMEQTKKLFEAFGQASSVLHLSSEQSQHALLALTEMMSRGTIQARQLNQQLGFAIPGSAARFKNAVMEAVKGTDLAGKSFMQLEKDGDLVTSRFMPQLIQALQEAGRGWQEAATGLNAQINRLKTSWFDLKTNMSGGLFNDAATSSIGFVASNLNHIATTLTTITALAGAAFVGKKISGAAEGIGSAIQGRRDAQAAAMEELSYAHSLQATALAQREEIAADADLHAQRVIDAQDEIARHQAAILELQDRQDVAAATLRQQEGAATLSANIRAQQVAEVELLKVTQQLAYEDQMAAGALMRRNEAMTLAVAADTKLMAANEALALSSAEVAAANEAQAATGFMATISAGAASAGESLLALAGGPVGIAVAAVAGIGYAFLSAREEAKTLESETNSLAQSTQDVMLQANQMLADYNTIGNSDPLSKLKDSEKSIGATIDANRAKIKAQQDEFAAMAMHSAGVLKIGGIDVGNFTGVGTAVAAYSFFVEKLSGKQHALAENTAKLVQTNLDLQDTYSAENAALVSRYSSAWAHVGDSLHSMKFSVDGLLDVIPRLGREFHDAIKNMAGIDTARASFSAYETQLETQANDVEKRLRQKGMSAAQRMADDHKQALAAAKTGGMIESPDQAATFASALADQQKLDALKKQRSGVDKLGNAYQSLMKTMREKVAADQEEMAGGSKLTDADKNLLKVKQDLLTNLRNLSPQRKQALLDEAQQFVNLTNEVEARRQNAKAMADEAAFRNTLDSMRARQDQGNTRALQGIGHGSQWNAETQALQRINDEYARKADEAQRAYQADLRAGVASGVALDKYNAKLSEVQSHLQAARAAQTQFFTDSTVAQANWKNGLTAALEDVRSTGANVAGQFQSLFTNAFSGMNDALANFVKTGKLNFTSLAQSFISDMLRIELQIAESKVLTAMFGDGTSGSSGFLGTLASFFGGSTTANANGGVYSSPGLSAHSGSVVSSPTMFAFAAGAGLMGEAGPEAIMPLSRGSDGKLGVKAQIGSNEPAAPIVNISIIGAPSQPTMSTSRGADGSINIEAKFEEMLANSMMNRKRGAQAMEHVYGLGRGGQSFG